MTYTDDDYYVFRVPKFHGWRTLGMNTAFVLIGAGLCFTAHREAGAAVCAVALVNIAMRLATSRRPAHAVDVLGAIWSPERRKPVPIVAALSATSESIRDIADRDGRLVTTLPPGYARHEPVDGLDDWRRLGPVTAAHVAFTGCTAVCASLTGTLFLLVA